MGAQDTDSPREKVIPFLMRKESLGWVLSVFNTFLTSADLPSNTETGPQIQNPGGTRVQLEFKNTGD